MLAMLWLSIWLAACSYWWYARWHLGPQDFAMWPTWLTVVFYIVLTLLCLWTPFMAFGVLVGQARKWAIIGILWTLILFALLFIPLMTEARAVNNYLPATQ